VPDDDLAKLHIDKSRITVTPARLRKPAMWAGAVVAAVVLILILKGFFGGAVTVPVGSVVQMYPSQTFTLLNASGYVVAERKAAVASKITGRLVELNVEEGSRVKKGQIIARLENADALAAKRQAEANLNVAKYGLEQANAELQDADRSLNRSKDLLAKGFISQSEYDIAEARNKKAGAAVAGARASITASASALEAAEASLEYTLIRAPFDAVVLTKNADIGDIITPIGASADSRSAVVTIADMKSLHVEVDVAESNLGKVKFGQPCEIQLDALPDLRFRGAVHMVVPTADRTKATVMVKVRFVDKDPRTLPEMSAKVAFLERPVKPEEQQPRTAVNKNAVIDRGDKKTLYVVKDGRAVETVVTLGRELGDQVEVASGVNPGDRIVLNPVRRIKDGTRIEAAER
jgi:RND family efflux transporter MFP subunit